MYPGSNRPKAGRLALVAGVVLAISLLVAPAAMAFPMTGGAQFGTQCDMCHTGGADAPVVTLVSNDGTNATYSVAANGIEWAVFNGMLHVAGDENGASNQFTVPVGSTYTVYDVLGDPGAASSGKTSVTPDAAPQTYDLVPSAGEHGSVSPDTTQTVNGGSDFTFTITPDEGYHIDTLEVDGAAVPATVSYTFSNVTANHTIVATFAEGEAPEIYTITPTAGSHGSISPSGVQSVEAGEDCTFTITPDTGYHIGTLKVDGAAVEVATSYSFHDVTANHTIEATFEADAPTSYTITASAGTHGTISPVGTRTVNAGGSLTFTIKADDGYHIDTLKVDGTAATTDGSYTFSNVSANHTIEVTFAANPPSTYGVQVVAGAHGSITPVLSSSKLTGSTVIVKPHDSLSFRVKADLGYHVGTVVIDGKPGKLTAGGLYTFTDVKDDKSIAVSFVANTKTSCTLRSSSSSVKHGKTVTLYAVLSGGVSSGSKVQIQALTPGYASFATIATQGVSSNGATSKKYKLAKKGTYYFRVTFAGSSTHAPSTSRIIKVISK